MARVLVVDDHSISRYFLTQVLSYCGHELAEAADGEEGLDVAATFHPDAVISDIVMPRMDGLEMAREMRRRPGTRYTPIVIYTATYRLPHARKLAASAGLTDIIRKPAEPAEIIVMLNKVLGLGQDGSEHEPSPNREATPARDLKKRKKEPGRTADAHMAMDRFASLEERLVSGRHLLSLVNDLLDVAKVESGSLELTVEATHCQEAIEEVVGTLRPMADAKGLALRVEMPKTPLRLHTDRRALNQIVINLCNNAIKFTQSGEVAVRLSRIRQNGSWAAKISVSDTGAGIRAEDKQRLFSAFSQLRSQSGAKPEGTGLGLYLSQKLAVLLGGEITLESEYGHGSTFTLTLPGRGEPP